MLTPAIFRHELIRAIKVLLPKDDQTALSQDMVGRVQAGLNSKFVAAWKLAAPARPRETKGKKRRA